MSHDPTPTASVWRRTDDPLQGLVPPVLAELARTQPDVALARLQPASGAGDTAVAAILRAELHLAQRRPDFAVTEAARAIALAKQAIPVPNAADGSDDRAQRVVRCAATVYADLLCWTGAPGAADACRALQDLATKHGDEPRLLTGHALHAVAVYHQQDCNQGHAMLTALLRHPHRDGTAKASLNVAVTFMRAWCRHRPVEQHRPQPIHPVPGGLLHPRPRMPSVRWLDQRLAVQPCAGTHETAGRPPPPGYAAPP